ncbi:MAG: metallophosphoesterase [Candidatus Thorarchaeota archaeon]|nr:metallophosphoesterase [Candidatus Thorarchaeota archaeon]
MKITAISDIHGNFNDSVVDLVKASDITLCLGDLVEFGEITTKAFDFLLQLKSAGKFLMIPGNCDTDCLSSFLEYHDGLNIHKKTVDYSGFSFAGFGGFVDAITYSRAMRAHFLSGTETFIESTLAQIEGSSWIKDFMQTLGLRFEGKKLVASPESDDLILGWDKFRSSCEFEENEIYDFFVLNASDCDIWLSHTPPFGFPGSERMGGFSIGSKGLLNAVVARQPQFVISGHIHCGGVWQLGKTICFSVPPMSENYALILNIDTDSTLTHEVIRIM